MTNKWVVAICMMVALILPTTALASGNAIKVIVNGREIPSDVTPVLDPSSGRVLVPMRAIFESLGYNVVWDTVIETGIAKLETPTETITASVQPDSQTLKVRYQGWLKAEDKKNGTNECNTDFYFMLPLDQNNPVRTINGRLMLPTRIISEALGATVAWDGTTRIVTINTEGAKIVSPKGWEKAISDNYKAISPDYYYTPGYDYEGAYDEDFTFNGVKGKSKPNSSVDENMKKDGKGGEMPQSTSKVTRKQVIVTGIDGQKHDITPVDTPDGTVYRVYDMEAGKVFEYRYKNQPLLTSPPTVGSFPAKILINESIKSVSYYKDPNGDLNDYNNWIMNLTAPYSVSLLSLGGCNWYAEGRFWEVTGVPIPHFRESDDKLFWKTEDYLNAADQYDELLAIRDKNDIQPNSIALFTSPTASHVLFVEYVERDSTGKPTNVYVTEANVNGNGTYRYGIDGEVTKYSFEGLKSRSNKEYQGCIVVNKEFYQ